MTVMKNAEHLAGALALELDAEVTWHPLPEVDLAIFECNGHQAQVSRGDLHRLDRMTLRVRRDLYDRVRRDLARLPQSS